jgi:hypothetical protein
MSKTTKTTRRATSQPTPKHGTSAGFNLRHLVRDVVASSPSPDYPLIAKEAARRIPPEHLEAALITALTEYVRHYATTIRPTISVLAAPVQLAESAAPARRPGQSPKVIGIRQAWRRYLDAPFGTATGQKWLGDCDAADLIFIAEDLEKKAAENVAKATGIRGLREEMGRHKAARVRDLPDVVLAAYLAGGAAA